MSIRGEYLTNVAIGALILNRTLITVNFYSGVFIEFLPPIRQYETYTIFLTSMRHNNRYFNHLFPQRKITQIA